MHICPDKHLMHVPNAVGEELQIFLYRICRFYKTAKNSLVQVNIEYFKVI